MEKLDYLVWRAGDLAVQVSQLLGGGLLLPAVRALTVSTADTDEEVPRPLLLMGRGRDLAALVEVWLDSVDDRGPLEAVLGPADGYLVTESVPQREPAVAPVGVRSSGLTHLTWFPKLP